MNLSHLPMPRFIKQEYWSISGILWLLSSPLISSANAPELLIHTHNGLHSFKVTTATCEHEQHNGLQGWNHLAINEGMLFVYPEPTQRPFWMKHISIPLDILFIDSDNLIVDIIQQTVPGAETPLIASKPFIAAFEVNAGSADRLGIRKGDNISTPAYRLTQSFDPYGSIGPCQSQHE